MAPAGPASAAELDALQSQLTQRLLESGEWDRIKSVLSSKLNESGWTDGVRNQSKERARAMEPLSFATLLEETSAHGQNSMPLAVRKQITALIRASLDKQFE